MKLTIPEYQALIDAKKWDELSETEIFGAFNYGEGYKDLSISKDMLTDFFFNTTRYAGAYSQMGYPSEQPLIDHLYEMILEQLKLSPEDWKHITTKAVAMLDKQINSATSKRLILGIQNKDANFIRAMFDDSFYQLLKNKFNKAGSTNTELKFFDDLTDEEIKKFPLEKISFGFDIPLYHVPLADQYRLARFFPSYKAIVKADFSMFRRISRGAVMKNAPISEFEGILKENMRKGLERTLLSYYKQNPDIPITDEILDLVFHQDAFAGNSMLPNNFITNMTKEQIVVHKDRLNVPQILQSAKFTLDELVEVKPVLKTANTDAVIQHKFFTEEEIVVHPNLFNPETLKNNSLFYVSKATFTILNRAWSKRQKYNTDLMDFMSIIRNMKRESKNIETFKYIQKKCEISDEELAHHMTTRHHFFAAKDSKDQNNLKILSDFFTQF